MVEQRLYKSKKNKNWSIKKDNQFDCLIFIGITVQVFPHIQCVQSSGSYPLVVDM